MRHGNKNNNLSRTASHRRALLMNLGCQLITYKRITTTLAKAKALRTYIEPLITKTKATETKESIMHNHRIVFSYLNDKAAVKELFTVVAPKVVGRPGGYTRIIKLGARTGDNAELAMIELVDFNDIYNNNITAGTEKTKRTRRSGGAAKKATTETAVASTTEETPATEETTADDLTLIEGVGPKGAEALAAGGLATFAAIAAATPEEISAVLEAADGSFNSMVPTSWPEQAQLAADGKFEELEALKDNLKGGREA